MKQRLILFIVLAPEKLFSLAKEKNGSRLLGRDKSFLRNCNYKLESSTKKSNLENTFQQQD
jgi:hypothetical protein